jgi:hypothetical protein
MERRAKMPNGFEEREVFRVEEAFHARLIRAARPPRYVWLLQIARPCTPG